MRGRKRDASQPSGGTLGVRLTGAEQAVRWLSAEQRPVSPRWWIEGPDDYQGGRVVEALRARLGPDAEYRSADEHEEPAELALWLAETGFFSKRRLLVWRPTDVGVFKRPPASDLLRAADEDAVLVVAVEKGAPPAGDFVVVTVPYRRAAEWFRFVQDEAGRRRLRLSADALRYVADATRPYGHYLEALLDKLSLAAGGRSSLDDETVAALVAPLPGSTPWTLAEAVLAGEGVRAWREWTRLEQAGVAPPLIVATLSRQLLQVEEWLGQRRRGVPLDTFLARAGIPAWQGRRLEEAARRWTPEMLDAWLTWADRVDGRVKRSEGDAAVLVSALVLAAGAYSGVGHGRSRSSPE